MKTYSIFTFIFFITIFSFFNTNIAFWELCKYSWQINECNSANIKWNTKSIDDFVCIVWTKEDVTYQVVLDEEFKKIDKEMDKYIENLEKNKNLYFWKSKKRTYIDWVNDIHKNSAYFTEKYTNVCWEPLIENVISCMPWWKTSIPSAENFFLNKWSLCKRLIEKKMEIYNQIAFSVLMLNKQQINADEKKIYDQWQRRNYDKLLDIMMINLWYIERIWQKTPFFTSKVHK